MGPATGRKRTLAWRHRLALRAGIALAAIVALIGGAALALDPAAAWLTRRALVGPGRRATFDHVEVHVADLSYVIRGLRIDEVDTPGRPRGIFRAFEAGRIRVALRGRDLLRGRLAGDLELDAPRLHLVLRKKGKDERPRAGAPSLSRKLSGAPSFLALRVWLSRGAVDWQPPGGGEPVLRIADIQGLVENVPLGSAAPGEGPTAVDARGVIQGSGRASVRATADPRAPYPAFEGEARLDGLRIGELDALVGTQSDVAPSRGTVDLALRFRAASGRITGALEVAGEGVESKAARRGLLAWLESELADATAGMVFGGSRSGHGVSATLALSGEVTSSGADPLPTILIVLRNAFVEGLTTALAGKPGTEPRGGEAVLQQARREKPEPGTHRPTTPERPQRDRP